MTPSMTPAEQRAMDRLAADKAAIQARADSGDADAAAKLLKFEQRYELLRVNYIADEKLHAVLEQYESAAKRGDPQAAEKAAYLRDNRAKERAKLVAKLQAQAPAAQAPAAQAPASVSRPDADLVAAAHARLDGLYAQAAGLSGAALLRVEEQIRELEFQAGLSPTEARARRAKASSTAEDPRDKILDELVLRLIPEILAQDSAAPAA